MKGLALLLTAAFLAGGCAGQRPVELLDDADKERLDKATFLGTSSAGTTWIYKATVVKTSPNGGFAFVGYQSDAKMGHFEFTKDKLKFFNDVSIFAGSQAAARELINEWDITHHDVRLAEVDGKTTNKEEEDTDKTWDQKRYFKVDWSGAKITEAATFPYRIDVAETFDCWKRKASSLVDDSLKASGDYIEFTVSVDYQQNTLCNRDIRRNVRGDVTFTAHYKYSFKKVVDTGYTPYVYKGKNGEVDPVMKRFGFFQTILETVNPNNEMPENRILMNRWDPRKEHNFYFAPGFPEDKKWIFNDPKKGIFAVTNKLFASKGLKTRFHARENTYGNGKVKEFGDIRYSFIKVIDELDTGAPLGYGPSDANPVTGEIIAANLVLWSAYLESYIHRLEDSFDREFDKYEDSSMWVSMKNTLELIDDELAGAHPKQWASSMDFSQGSGKLYMDMLPEITYGYPGWAAFTAHEPMKTKDIFNFREHNHIEEMMNEVSHNHGAMGHIHDSRSEMQAHMDRELVAGHHDRNSVVYAIEPVLAGIQNIDIRGKKAKDVVDTILYRVAIHELGHNLGLRHNFYGSVDKKNFRPAKFATDSNGDVIIDDNGLPVIARQKSSSVMDYLALEDEVFLDHDWEKYDEAALLYAYSGGAVDDKETDYLFCTDEHRVLNALCNAFDVGSTPSEILMSHITRYENQYHVLNFRRDRAYWNTGGYASRVFSSMWDVKKMMLLWRTALTRNNMIEKLDAQGAFDQVDDREATIKDLVDPIQQELIKSLKLAMVFYNAVIQQKNSDRPWGDRFDDFSGERTRLGIIYDKIFAMQFLMGDEGFMYNPNASSNYASFLAYWDVPELTTLIDTIFENTLTKRVDMEPWFIGYGRVLYAIAATNPVNESDVSLIEKIGVKRYDSQELAAAFGLSHNDIQVVKEFSSGELESVNDAYFDEGEELAIAEIRGLYYAVSKFRNPYAYDIVKQLKESVDGGYSVKQEQQDLQELYYLFLASQNDRR